MQIQMIPEIGHFALVIALLFAIVQSVVPLAGAALRRPLWMAYARPMAAGQFLFVAIAYAALTASYMLDDFSVLNVANNSNSMLPWYYKFSAVWGNHEGSVLLWSMMLAGWGYFAVRYSRELPRDMVARVISVLGMVCVGFLLFILVTSNPFERLLPQMPQDGADLNPLLQDIGLIMHPPMLYMGYVGFSVVFAFAIAALLGGRLDAAWARWARPWTNLAWAFLTIGIALGSWWAYYELGWGGWWFWDPVENASLLPWLTGTALMHSLAVTEKRGSFKSWTLLLAITTFSLSLLGTFLVRSGVLTSVHAFANDPSRGFFILMLLGITVGLSLLVFALRAPRVSHKVGFGWLSRDAMLLINNIMLVILTVTVLLGTVYPLLLDALNLGKISVGPPYFNALFVPLTLLMCVFMGMGPISRWKDTSSKLLIQRLWLSAVVAVVLGMALPLIFAERWSAPVAIGIIAALWIVLPMLRDLYDKTRHASSVGAGLKKLSLAYWGMQLGHLGVAVTIIGVAVVSNYNIERNVRMSVGDSVSVAGYTFTMTELASRRGPNFLADRAVIEVQRDGRTRSFTMNPEKRLYIARGMPMTQVALRPGFFRDLYVAMGEDLGDNSWAMRVQYKPFVRWLWLGGLLMAAGGVLAVADKRYRRLATAPDPEEAAATSGAKPEGDRQEATA
ncbi:heme lyase CcmF/NrfE family subunit [Halomonas daqingensis]|uniref:Heme lyase CcmF/NrfE family subunit n=2 Tax=Billgrantia desiderata TaxID=52021 RepID=A0AAW4YQK1_9GAMM|nr:heme lyase CcmF/NrfE family subunit [Halomonas desiderata]MCE8042636.1 heme lyase CcmF/NrfE family subunit [Halomonas desiderata]MCE8047211.1 heme lyase CcmF/NrfE family subunit [Halomonas desiderata]MCE8050532.1 heme lyase CcmF/NrfE family subunit [Halomonas desiderata]SEG35703.1 cytochrome c-type biogenesis protein CcmF [Halomonas desiderata]